MNTKELINEVLDRARQDRNLPSDSALARELGVSNNAIWRWRAGKAHPKTILLLQLLAEQIKQPEALKTAA